MQKKILDWLIASSWFKKYSAMIGGFALGMYFQAKFWHQIRATLDVWGVTHSEWMKFLLAVAGAAGIVVSVGLTMVKNQRTMKVAKPVIVDKPVA